MFLHSSLTNVVVPSSLVGDIHSTKAIVAVVIYLMGAWNQWNEMLEWNGGMEYQNRDPKTALLHNSRFNRVGKHSRSGDHLINNRGLGD